MPKHSRQYSNLFRILIEGHVFQQLQTIIWVCGMTDAQIKRKMSTDLRIGKIEFSIEHRTVIRAERFILDTHTVIYSHPIGS